MTIELNGIKLSAGVYGTLEWVGRNNAECVAEDLETLKREGRNGLLEQCLDGDEDDETNAAWREYVETLEAALANDL